MKRGRKIGHSVSKETREKIRQSLFGRKLPEEHKLKIRKNARRGKKHTSWKGDKAGYFAIHIWLKNNYGKASKCKNPNCVYPRKNQRGKMMYKPKRYEWALLKGKKHIHRRKNYIQLCCSCHQKYDWNKIKLTPHLLEDRAADSHLQRLEHID